MQQAHSHSAQVCLSVWLDENENYSLREYVRLAAVHRQSEEGGEVCPSCTSLLYTWLWLYKQSGMHL